MPGNDYYRWQVRSFTVLLALDVIDRMNVALRDPKISPSEEQGGLLFGRSLGDNTIEVTDFELLRSGHRRGVSYDLSPHERNRVSHRVQVLSGGKGPQPVGCFRTHLRPGLFLDLSDVALLTQTFDETGIILAISMNQQGPADAGIFFRENDDIDGRQPGLKFPFHAEALRAQGPIEERPASAPAQQAASAWNRMSISRKTLVSGGVYALAGAILALATITGLIERDRKPSAAKVSEVLSPAAQNPAGPGESEILSAPPAVFDDEPLNLEDAANADSATPGFRTPFAQPLPAVNPQPATQARASADAPPFRDAAPPAEPAVPPPSPDPLPVSLPVSPPDTPLLAANLPPVAPAPPPARTPLSIDVSIEPKEDGALKRAARSVPAAMGHVPLLGRLPGLRRDHDENVVAARPYEDLSPHIPAAVSRNLAEQVVVDVDASIDEQGEVRNTEVVRGDDPQLSSLAEDAVRSSRWKPARSGDRNVAMNVVVHYRFSPGREP